MSRPRKKKRISIPPLLQEIAAEDLPTMKSKVIGLIITNQFSIGPDIFTIQMGETVSI